MNKLTTDQLQSLTDEMNDYMTETGRERFPSAKADELREMDAKRCGRCSAVKNLEDFHNNPRTRDGLKGICKACNSADHADFRKRNPEYKRNYREENREQLSEYNRDYYEQNREYYREYNREYREQNRERLNEHKRDYNRTQWATDELYRLQRQLRQGYSRAVQAGNQADWITPEQLFLYWDAKGIPALECYLTGESLTPFNRSIDHTVAISNGGTHTVDNLLPCTWAANKRKANLEPDDVKELFTND